MFAGPNGSGKSTLKDVNWLGVYVNADDIEAEIRAHGFASVKPYGVSATQAELLAFFAGSDFLREQGLDADAQKIQLKHGRVIFDAVAVNSYFASVLADFIRNDLLRRKKSFTFETVMSTRAKVEFFCRARKQGVKTYLYYVATEDPEINISRVAHRVRMGKHDVPRNKIIERYHRSLALLADAVTCDISHRLVYPAGSADYALDVMIDSKNIAPYGWYVGSYLLRFIELAEEGNEDPERRFVTWENTVLVKANNLDEAYDKVVKVAMQSTEPYKGGSEGIDVQWVFEGVTNLLPIYEEIEDGAEIMWGDHAPRKLKNIRKQARRKSEFFQ